MPPILPQKWGQVLHYDIATQRALDVLGRAA
jgi:hypothetical protein